MKINTKLKDGNAEFNADDKIELWCGDTGDGHRCAEILKTIIDKGGWNKFNADQLNVELHGFHNLEPSDVQHFVQALQNARENLVGRLPNHANQQEVILDLTGGYKGLAISLALQTAHHIVQNSAHGGSIRMFYLYEESDTVIEFPLNAGTAAPGGAGGQHGGAEQAPPYLILCPCGTSLIERSYCWEGLCQTIVAADNWAQIANNGDNYATALKQLGNIWGDALGLQGLQEPMSITDADVDRLTNKQVDCAAKAMADKFCTEAWNNAKGSLSAELLSLRRIADNITLTKGDQIVLLHGQGRARLVAAVTKNILCNKNLRWRHDANERPSVERKQFDHLDAREPAQYSGAINKIDTWLTTHHDADLRARKRAYVFNLTGGFKGTCMSLVLMAHRRSVPLPPDVHHHISAVNISYLYEHAASVVWISLEHPDAPIERWV